MGRIVSARLRLVDRDIKPANITQSERDPADLGFPHESVVEIVRGDEKGKRGVVLFVGPTIGGVEHLVVQFERAPEPRWIGVDVLRRIG